MWFGNIMFAVGCWLCSLIFAIIAFWAFKRKDPMHFWSGSTVSPKEIEDIPKYNRANGFMWTIYTLFMVAVGIVSLFSTRIGAVLLVILCFPGLVILILVYNSIYNKYRNSSPTDKPYSSLSETSKKD